MPTTSCGHCGKPLHISEEHAEEGTEFYCSRECVGATFAKPATRHWQVERLMGGNWLATDWEQSGPSEAVALERAADIAKAKDWEAVRLGRELTEGEHHRYCSFAWITLN